MANNFRLSPRAALAVTLASAALCAAASASGADVSVKKIVARNIEASGGKGKLKSVAALSFKAGASAYVVSAKGEMKVVTRGRDASVVEILLVDASGAVRRQAKDATSEVSGPEAVVPRTLAKVLSGVFTLAGFEGKLEYDGLRAYGPEKFYALKVKTKDAGLTVEFLVRPDDGHLKSLLFQGVTAEGDVFKVNYEFSSFENVEGLSMPMSWFNSRVGGRGSLAELSEVKVNPPLAGDFFKAF